MELNWDAIGAIGDFLGSIGVPLSIGAREPLEGQMERAGRAEFD